MLISSAQPEAEVGTERARHISIADGTGTALATEATRRRLIAHLCNKKKNSLAFIYMETAVMHA